MSRSVHSLPSLGPLGNLPWRTRVGDRRAVRKLLIAAGVDPRGALAGALLPVVSQRVSDCRDLFVLLGVRTKRRSVLQMAGRALASDAEQIAELDAVTNGMAGALLRALSDLIEVRAGHVAHVRAEPVALMREPADALTRGSKPAHPRVDPRSTAAARRHALRQRIARRPTPCAPSSPDAVVWSDDDAERLAA